MKTNGTNLIYSGMGELSDLISNVAHMQPHQLEDELARVSEECRSSKEKLHEAVYESGVLFLKIADWTDKMRGEFETMLDTLNTVQRCHDSVIAATTTDSTS